MRAQVAQGLALRRDDRFRLGDRDDVQGRNLLRERPVAGGGPEWQGDRQREQRAAAAVLGAADVTFLGAIDGELEATTALRRAVAEVVRATRPDVVLGHDPWQRYRLHPDHRAAGFLTTDGVVAARDWHFFPDAGPPHRPQELWLFEADEPDHVEGIDGTLDRKVAALLAHRSQWRSTMGIDDDADAVTAAAQTLAFTGRIAGVAAVAAAGHTPRHGEAFRRIREL